MIPKGLNSLNRTSLAPPPAAPLPVALPPPPSLQPIGLAFDDPHLQRMINFRSRGLTRFAYPWRTFPHLARPSLLLAPSRPAPARPLCCPPPSTFLPALNSQPTPTTSTRCVAPAAPSPPNHPLRNPQHQTHPQRSQTPPLFLPVRPSTALCPLCTGLVLSGRSLLPSFTPRSIPPQSTSALDPLPLGTATAPANPSYLSTHT